MAPCTLTITSLAAATLAILSGPGAADEYSFTLVDAFVNNYDLRECYIYDLNELNQACGTATIQIPWNGGTMITYTGFYWSPESEKTPIGLSWPHGISNTGMIGGVSQVFDMPSGQYTNLPLLPGTYPPLVVLGVNDGGTAVGYVQICNCSNSQGTLQVPYVWNAANGARSLPVPGAKGAARINNNGMIVGWIGGNSMPDSYVYDLNSSTWMYMSSVFSGPNVQTTAVDVNDAGVVVGLRKNENGSIAYGYTWSAEQGVVLLPLPPSGFQAYVKPTSINIHGTVVGSIYTPNASSRAFVYDATHGIRDLHTLTTPAAGFTMMTATAINDNGWIAGYGYGGGGMYKSFILAPIVVCDVTGDGLVNISDILAVLAAWGACQGTCAADLTADGVVNIADLLLVISHWS